MKKLIVNADDFGQSHGVNKGIIYAYENGIVRSASLMVRYPAVTEAAAYAKKNPTLGVGLHVDLGEWIYRDGAWQSLYEVVPLNDLEKVEEVVCMQLEEFNRIMGRKPTHIDSHQHVHLREAILPIFVSLAKTLDVTLRRCSEKVNYCGDFYGQLSDGSPYHQAISVEGLKQIIKKLPDGYTEMACHPALGDDIVTMYREERKNEVDTLIDKDILELVGSENIELCSFEGIPYQNELEIIL